MGKQPKACKCYPPTLLTYKIKWIEGHRTVPAGWYGRRGVGLHSEYIPQYNCPICGYRLDIRPRPDEYMDSDEYKARQASILLWMDGRGPNHE